MLSEVCFFFHQRAAAQTRRRHWRDVDGKDEFQRPGHRYNGCRGWTRQGVSLHLGREWPRTKEAEPTKSCVLGLQIRPLLRIQRCKGVCILAAMSSDVGGADHYVPVKVVANDLSKQNADRVVQEISNSKGTLLYTRRGETALAHVQHSQAQGKLSRITTRSPMEPESSNRQSANGERSMSSSTMQATY